MTTYYAQVSSVGFTSDPSSDWENGTPQLAWTLFVVRSSDSKSRGASGGVLITSATTASSLKKDLRTAVEGVLIGWGLTLSDVNIVYLEHPTPG